MKSSTFLFILISTLISCLQKDNEKQYQEIHFSRLSDTRMVTGRPVHLKTDLINPTHIGVIDSLLVILDIPNKVGSILLFNLNNDFSFLGATGKEGQGPGEYIGLTKIVTHGKFLYAFDITMSTITKISIDSVLSNPGYVPNERLRFSRPKIHNLAVIDTNNLIVGFYRENPRLRQVNQRGDSLHSFYNYLHLPNTYRVPEQSFLGNVRGNLLQIRLAYNKRNQLLAASYYNTAKIDLIDVKTRQVKKRIYGPDDTFPPQYVLTESGRSALKEDSKHSYLDLKFKKNNLYALYSGKTYKEGLIQGDQLFVFDNEGTPIKKLSINPGLFSFAVDEERKKIYGVNFYDSPLYVYNF